MKRSLILITLVSALGTQVIAMPSRATLTGVAFLTGAGLMAVRNARAIKDKVVSTTTSFIEGIKDSSKRDKHFERNLGLGLAGLGIMMFIPYNRIMPEREDLIESVRFGVEALGVTLGVIEIGREVHSYYADAPQGRPKKNNRRKH